MKISQLFENAITLNTMYNGKLPERSENIWNHISRWEFDIPFDIHVIPSHKLKILLLSQYQQESIDDVLDLIDDEERKELVMKYSKNPTLSDQIIVLADDLIVDGNHRALAAALGNKSIKYIDITEIEGE